MSDDASKYDDEKKQFYKKIVNLKGKATSVSLDNNIVCVKYKDEDTEREILIEL